MLGRAETAAALVSHFLRKSGAKTKLRWWQQAWQSTSWDPASWQGTADPADAAESSSSSRSAVPRTPDAAPRTPGVAPRTPEGAPESPPHAAASAASAQAVKKQRGERGGPSRRSQINYKLKRSGHAQLSAPPGEGHLTPSARTLKEQVFYEVQRQLRTKAAAGLLLHLHSESLDNRTGPLYGPCIRARARTTFNSALLPPQSCTTRQLALHRRRHPRRHKAPRRDRVSRGDVLGWGRESGVARCQAPCLHV